MEEVNSYPLVSAIVLNYNGEAYLFYCLDSLEKQDYPNLEIIVVDNGSTDQSQKVVENYSGVKFRKLEKNYGFSIGNNLGASMAKGKHLFFLNNDIRISSDCISKLVEVLSKNDKLFAVETLQYDWEGKKILRKNFMLYKRNLRESFILNIRGGCLDSAPFLMEVPCGCGSSLMVKKDRFEELKGFDPKMFMDFEDTDLSWRAYRRGWSILFQPQAKAYHMLGMATGAKEMLRKRKYFYIKNRQRFLLKLMPWDLVFFDFFICLVENLMRVLFFKDVEKAFFFFKAFFINLLDFKNILKERIDINKESIYSSRYLLNYFLNLGKEIRNKRYEDRRHR